MQDDKQKRPRKTRRQIWADKHSTTGNRRREQRPKPSRKLDDKEKETIETKIEDNTSKDKIKKEKAKTKEKTKDKDKSAYSLKGLTTGQKIYFGFNVSIKVIRNIVLLIVCLGLLIAALALGVGVGYFASLVKDTPAPTRQEMSAKINRLEQQSTIYYSNGTSIADIQSDIVRTNTELEDISPYIIDGLIATEDEYFYEHKGVLPKAIIRAVIQEALTPGVGTGGSTLTQQLVKQQLLTSDVTFSRKANEILLALRLENYFTKDEILTAYLNVSPFGRNNLGENVAGIEQAAQGIFGVSAKDVTLPQAAFLVGLPQDPYNYTPYENIGRMKDDLDAGVERKNEVLFRMYRGKIIDKDTYEQAVAYDITKDFIPAEERGHERMSYLYQAMMNGATKILMKINIQNDRLTWEQVYADDDLYNEYYFAAQNQLKTGGYHVYTTIDKEIYDQMQVSAKAYEDNLGISYEGVYTDPDTGFETFYTENVQIGMVAIENETGKVLGFVSGTDFENNQIDHAFNVRRSPGSTIKPLAVYAPAIEYNLISPATMIPDTAFELVFEDGSVWAPTNYGYTMSNELISAREALYRSDNLPAVRIYQELLDRQVPISDYLEKMGFDKTTSYSQEDTHNLAFSLGGVTKGPTVFEQTRAFTTFANNGNYIDGHFIERIEDSEGNIIYQHDNTPVEVFREDTNYLVVDMLRDTLSVGTGRFANETLNMGGDWIMKSGVSENSKDVWTIASTPKITIGAWIGYDSKYGDYTFDLNDGFGGESRRSQYLWANTVNDLYAIRPEVFGVDEVFQQPDSVYKAQVLKTTGTLPGAIMVDNNFVKLTEPLREDVFKTTNPAPDLTYDFIFAADEDTTRHFWGKILQQAQERKKEKEDESESSSENENENENQNENQGQTQEGTGPNQQPVTPPAGEGTGW